MQFPEDFFNWRIICFVRSRFGVLRQYKAPNGQTKGERRTPQFLINLVLVVTVSIPFLSTNSQGSNSQPIGGSYVFNIPSQPVEQALDSFAKQTGLLLLFPYDQVQSIETSSLAGKYSIEKALSILLQGTGLSSDLTKGGVIAISRNGLNDKGKRMNITTKKSLLATMVGLFAASGVGTAVAQGQEGATSQARLDEIIVTAQKREQSIQDVPISINALSGNFLVENNITDFINLEFYLPGIDINETTPNGNDFSLRGIPNGGSFLGLSSVMDVYWNGAVIPQEVSLSSMYDMDRVEVLRGPQGSLQGRPAPAGVIMMYSKRPNVNMDTKLDGRIRSKVRDDGGYEMEGGVSVALIPDELAVRVSGLWGQDDGRADYTNFSGAGPEREYQAGRITMAWSPTDRFDAILTSEINKREETGVVGYLVGDGLLGEVTPYSNSRTLRDYEEYEKRYNQHNLELTLNLESHRLTSLSSYGELDAHWFIDNNKDTLGVLPNFMNRDRDYLSQEIRFESIDSEFWEYMIGGYFSKSSLLLTADFPTINLFLAFPENHEQKGVFTFHQFNLNEKMTLQAGLRWQRYEDEKAPFSFTEEALTGSAQLSYQFSDDIMGYLSYQRGYRPPGAISKNPPFNPAPDSLFQYDEEVSDSFEVGVKSVLLDGRLQLNVNLYRQEFSGFPLATGQVSTDANLDGVFELDNNVGPDASTRYVKSIDLLAQGLEVEWQALLTDNWTLSGALAWNDVEFGANAILPCSVFDELTGDAVFPSGELFSTCNNAGATIDQLRELTGSVTTEYTVPELIQGNEWYIRGAYNYQGEAPTTQNSTVEDLGAVGILNLYTGLRSGDGRWDVSLWVENLTDEQQLLDFLDGSNFNTYIFANGFVEERRFGMSVNYNFSM